MTAPELDPGALVQMDAALCFFHAAPTAGTLVVAFLNGAGAGCGVAADRDVAFFPQGMMGEIVLLHVIKDVARGPAQNRRDRPAVVASVPLQDLHLSPLLRLVAAHPANPRRGRQFPHRTVEHLVLVRAAARL